MKILLLSTSFIDRDDKNNKSKSINKIVEQITTTNKFKDVKILGVNEISVIYNRQGIKEIRPIKNIECNKYNLVSNVIKYIKSLGKQDIIRVTTTDFISTFIVEVIRVLNKRVKILNENVLDDDKFKRDIFLLKNKDLLERYNINLIPTEAILNNKQFNRCDKISTNKIIKISSGMQGSNIFLVRNSDKCKNIIRNQEITKGVVLLQDFIDNGGDFRFLQVGQRFIVYKRTKTNKNIVVNNISQGGEAQLIYQDLDLRKRRFYVSDKQLNIQVISVINFIRALNKRYNCFDLIGWDFFIEKNKIYFIEFNTRPGTKGARQYGFNIYNYFKLAFF